MNAKAYININKNELYFSRGSTINNFRYIFLLFILLWTLLDYLNSHSYPQLPVLAHNSFCKGKKNLYYSRFNFDTMIIHIFIILLCLSFRHAQRYPCLSIRILFLLPKSSAFVIKCILSCLKFFPNMHKNSMIYVYSPFYSRWCWGS